MITAQQKTQTSNSSAAAAVAAAAAASATASSQANAKSELDISIETNEDDAQKQKCPSTSELSDCGYGTQVENQESISTSSNEDNYPCQKVHQKPPCNQKQRYNAVNNPRSAITAQEKKELRRKKLVKRSKSSLYVVIHSTSEYSQNNKVISFMLLQNQYEGPATSYTDR